MPENYQNLDGGMAYTLEKEKSRRRKSMLIVRCHPCIHDLRRTPLNVVPSPAVSCCDILQVIICILVLLCLVGGGVAAWYFLTHRNKGSGGSSSGSGSDVDVGSDPSKFEKDSSLHKSFYGLAYTPEGSLMPNCGNKLGGSLSGPLVRLFGAEIFCPENVIKDIQVCSTSWALAIHETKRVQFITPPAHVPTYKPNPSLRSRMQPNCARCTSLPPSYFLIYAKNNLVLCC